MYRLSTPTHTFTLELDLGIVDKLRISYAQRDHIILTKNTEDVTIGDGKISLKLTQEETRKFEADVPAQIQLRILTIDGTALVSEIFTTDVKRSIDSEVLV